jgi:nitrate/nitrite transport system substrate-binding protein
LSLTSLSDAFDADKLRFHCACDELTPTATLILIRSQPSEDNFSASFMEAALIKALFPVDNVRQGFNRRRQHRTRDHCLADAAMGALQPWRRARAAGERRLYWRSHLRQPLIMDPLGLY